jgi:hypothetical protein
MPTLNWIGKGLTLTITNKCLSACSNAMTCYPLPPNPDKHNAEYAAKLSALTHQLGFPKHYVASIRQ